MNHQYVKAVFFDAGGTLLEPFPSVGEIYATTASKYGMRVEPHPVEAAFREEFSRRDGTASITAHASEKNERAWWHDLVHDVFRRVTELRDFEAFFDELYDLFARAEAWRVYPEVIQVLESLRAKGLVTGIVSNWDSRLLGICKATGLARHFDFILASALVGSAKPHPGIFNEALKRAGVRPEEALHVGDSIEDDVLGARRAGLHALFINRNGRVVNEVDSITSLVEILQHLD